MNNIKSINGLMKYLREKHEIEIEGSNHKRELKNIGYYHGYKGYRYIKKPINRIKFQTFDELLYIIGFDNKLKALLYPQVMFIETALKSYALEIIIQDGRTESFSEIYSNLMTDYKSYPNQSDNYKNAYKKRLDTYNRIQNVIATSYASDNNIVSHYLKNDESVPIWAIFEIITLGEFGNLISTFNLKTRKNISKDIGLNISFDSSGKLVENIIFLIKDLRNAIAHNNVIFDTRFRHRNVNTTLLKALSYDTDIQGINFTSIIDYIVLVYYILKKLNKTSKELSENIVEFIRIVEELRENIPQSIFDQIILTNDLQKLQILKKFIKK